MLDSARLLLMVIASNTVTTIAVSIKTSAISGIASGLLGKVIVVPSEVAIIVPDL